MYSGSGDGFPEEDADREDRRATRSRMYAGGGKARECGYDFHLSISEAVSGEAGIPQKRFSGAGLGFGFFCAPWICQSSISNDLIHTDTATCRRAVGRSGGGNLEHDYKPHPAHVCTSTTSVHVCMHHYHSAPIKSPIPSPPSHPAAPRAHCGHEATMFLQSI